MSVTQRGLINTLETIVLSEGYFDEFTLNERDLIEMLLFTLNKNKLG